MNQEEKNMNPFSKEFKDYLLSLSFEDLKSLQQEIERNLEERELEIRALEKKIDDLVKGMYDNRRRNSLIKSYINTQFGTTVRKFSVRPPHKWENKDGIRFFVRESIALPDGTNVSKKTYETVEYYRFNGVLLNRGLGSFVLKTPQVCSDEDWENLKNGIVDERFYHAAK